MSQLTNYPVWLFHEDGCWQAQVATRNLVAASDQGGTPDDALYALSRAIAGTLAFCASRPDEKFITWDAHLQERAEDYEEDFAITGLVHPETMPDVQLVLMTVKKRDDGVDIEFSTGRADSFSYSSWNWEKTA